MFIQLLLRRAAVPALILGPLALGLPLKAGAAFVFGALAGLAIVLPFLVVLRLVSLRQLLGWPLWLAMVALRLIWRSRRLA